MKRLSEFTFAILCYNHSDYIVIHLESIKYQILTYGKGIKCNLIITDDHSRDDSVKKIERWLLLNQEIFNSILILKNPINRGTCYCTKVILKNLNTQYFKLTAGDDFYSSSNIFDFVNKEPHFDLLSGLPLRMKNEKIYLSKFEIICYLASEHIYKTSSLIKRLSNVSIINAPNLFYAGPLVKKTEVQSILDDFDVTEDLPLQIAIAENKPKAKLISKKTPIVIYRRTDQSTYLVVNDRFTKDQIKAFDLLLEIQRKQKNYLLYLLLIIRKFLFSRKNRFLKIFVNPTYYIFLLKSIFYFPKIILDLNGINNSILKEQAHFNELKKLIKGFD